MGLKLITALFICMALYEAEGGSWSRCKKATGKPRSMGWKCMKVKKSPGGWTNWEWCNSCGTAPTAARGKATAAVGAWSTCKVATRRLKNMGWKCYKEKRSAGGRTSFNSCKSCGPASVANGRIKYRGNGLGKRANSIGEVAKECLEAHNYYRRKYGNRNNLGYSAKIATGSADWALKLADDFRLKRPKDRLIHSLVDYGENLYYAGGKTLSDKAAVWDAVKSWYSEINLWGNCRSPSSETGHFTQVVWKGSKDVGCGVARYRNNVIVVGRYNPGGNMAGAYCKNV